jgi:hypothetical protein
MLPRNLLNLLGVLMVILWANQPAQPQSTPEIPLKKQTCGDLWPVQQDKKWGYIDKTGKLIIPFKFDHAGDFSEGLAAVKLAGKYGYIDQTGKVVIPPRFDGGRPFSEGLAVVVICHFDRKGEILRYRYGYIDKSGTMVIQPRGVESLKWLSMFFRGLAFSEGRACMKQGKLGFIDKTGKMVIPARYNDVQPFSEGLAAVKVKGKYGYINRSGKIVIPPQFNDAGPFFEGLAPVHGDASRNQGGYIDKSGKLIINGAEFVLARAFSEGLAAVMGKKDKYGYIDKSGKFVIPPQFERVGDFSEGLAPVILVDAGWPGDLAYINQRGQMVIKSKSTVPDRPYHAESDLRYYHFCGGVARVALGKDEGGPDAEGYINKEGKFIWPEGR